MLLNYSLKLTIRHGSLVARQSLQPMILLAICLGSALSTQAQDLKIKSIIENPEVLVPGEQMNFDVAGDIQDGESRKFRVVLGDKIVQEGEVTFHGKRARVGPFFAKEPGNYTVVVNPKNEGFDPPAYTKGVKYSWIAQHFEVKCPINNRTAVKSGTLLQFTVSGPVPDGVKRDYRILHNTLTTVQEGKLTFSKGEAKLDHLCNQSGSYTLIIDAFGRGFDTCFYNQNLKFTWASDMERLMPALPRPSDFDTFWNGVKAGMDALPMKPILTKISEEADGIEVYSFEIDAGGGQLGTCDGVQAMGYLAKPKGEGPFPAMMVTYGAGSLKAEIGTVVGNARRGALCLALNPHPLPSDQPESFYQQKRENELRDYNHIGRDDRSKSYFLGMFRRCYRAAKFIETNPLWDKKHFIVNGFSQGGAQAFATAYLCKSITAIDVLCPAMVDHIGPLVGRRQGWPDWISDFSPESTILLRPDYKPVIIHKDQMEASRYYDVINFASGMRIPALIGVGMLDYASPPASDQTVFNLLAGPKEIILQPDTGHGADQSYINAENIFLKKELGQ